MSEHIIARLDAAEEAAAPLGLTWKAQGDANDYAVLRDGNWLMQIRVNGELLVTQQEALLNQLTMANPELLKAVQDANTLLTLIHHKLHGKEWDSETLDSIADHLRDYGLDIRAPRDCTCDDRSWVGDVHDSACPLAGLNRDTE